MQMFCCEQAANFCQQLPVFQENDETRDLAQKGPGIYFAASFAIYQGGGVTSHSNKSEGGLTSQRGDNICGRGALEKAPAGYGSVVSFCRLVSWNKNSHGDEDL